MNRLSLTVVLACGVSCQYYEVKAEPGSLVLGRVGDECATNRDCRDSLCITGRCRYLNTCAYDVDCGAGRHCRHNVCHGECNGLPDCHVGEVCGSSGTCEYDQQPAGRSCTKSCDCGMGQLCESGSCVKPAAGGTACTGLADCGAGEDCVDAHCRQRCTGASGCGSGEVCASGYCGPARSCVDDCGCPAGALCSGGVCQP